VYDVLEKWIICKEKTWINWRN